MRYRLAFAVLIASELFGCADVARWVRQFTYPPDFRYIERDEVRSAMRQLAHHSRELNRLLQHSDAPKSSEMKSSSTCEAWKRPARN